MFLDLPRRVAKVLLSQPRDEDGLIRLRMSQEQLAHQAAGTRQSVNAALRGFERRGWIEVQDRAVTVKQPGLSAASQETNPAVYPHRGNPVSES